MRSPEDPWISPRVASLLLGASEMMVYKYALLGRIRTRIEAGVNVRFCRDDVAALARARGRATRAAGRA